MKPHEATPSDLLELSLYGFAEHCRELLGKWSEMSPAQRREFREIGASILVGEKREAA